MEALFEALLDWIGTNPGWAYFLVGLAALGESLALIGMIVPGVVIMIGAGALIATGTLAFWPTVFVAVAGAIAGDGLSYWLGRHFRGRIRGWWPFNRHPQHLEHGIAFFQRYGGKSVAFGRFFGPGRAVIPLVAGMLQMPPRRFLIANVASALAWAPAYLAPGIVFGASLKLAAEAAARLVILLLLLIVLLWLAIWMARRLYRLLSPRASAWLQGLLRWADIHPKVGRVAQALADPGHPDAATLAALAASLIGSTAVLGLSVGAGLFGAQELIVNQIALDLAQSLHTPLADHVMAGLSRLGDAAVTVPSTLAIVGYLILLGHRRDAGYWLAAAGFAAVATPLLGWLLQVPRPELGLDLRWPWSFPSAHALSATLLYGFLAVALSRSMPLQGRWIPYAAATVLIGAVAVARLYFGSEWLTDIIGSTALGLAWIATLGLALHRHARPFPHWAGLAGVALLSATAAFSAASLTRHQADIVAYTPRHPDCSATAEAWRSRTEIPVPGHRQDLWRRNQRPFDLQYAGRLDVLAEALAPAGWQRAEMLGWHNAIELLSPSLPLTALPVIPHVHDGRHGALVLVKDLSPDQRLVLRLWSTQCTIAGETPLWVGDVTALRKDNIVDLLALPITVTSPDPSGLALEWTLKQTESIDVDPGQPLLMAMRDSRLLQ